MDYLTKQRRISSMFLWAFSFFTHGVLQILATARDASVWLAVPAGVILWMLAVYAHSLAKAEAIRRERADQSRT